MNNTNVLFKNDLEKKINMIVENLKILLNNSENIFSETSLSTINSESYHLLTRYLKPFSKFDKPIYNLFFNSVLQSERLSGGSGYINLQFVLGYIREYFKYKNSFEINIKNNDKSGSVENFDKELLTLIKVPTFKDIQNLLEYQSNDNKIKEILLEAIQLAGLDAKLRIETGNQEGLYIIESKKGFYFNIETYPFYFNKEEPSIEYNNFKILIIDGVIERVSEIEQLLFNSINTGIPMVIVSQGFSEEILATIKANNDRKVFSIIPVKTLSDLEGLNTINDICSVCGGDIVSTLKGDMTVFKKYDDLPIVDYIKITNNQIVIENNKQTGSVLNQLKTLLDKRKEIEKTGINDLSDLIDKRIKSLFSHSVIIKLPIMNKGENETVRTKLDILLRELKSLLSYGFIEKQELLSLINKYIQLNSISLEDKLYFNSLIETINSIKRNQISYFGFVSALNIGRNYINQILNSSTIIYIDD